VATFVQNSDTSAELDVELQFPGDRFPVIAGPVLLGTGWRGGIWVMYAVANDDFTVEVSDGNAAAGFLLFQSEDYALVPPYGTGPGSPENWLSRQFLVGRGGQNVATMVCGGTRCMFRVFETVALGGGVRNAGAITYNLNDILRVSENGLLCNDSAAQLALIGVATPVAIGIVSSVPVAANQNRLGVDIKY
jgi:hypothetical protein